MNPLTKADLAKLEPTKSNRDRYEFIEIKLELFNNLLFQARQAIEMEEALEWVQQPDRVICIHKNKSCVIFNADIAVKFYGATPLEAIQAAMKAEKESSTKQ